MIDEEQSRSVRRPLQPPDFPRDRRQLAGLAAAAPQPDFAAPGEGQPVASGRESRRMALADQQRGAALRGDHEDLLRRRQDRRSGVGKPVVGEFGMAAADEGEGGAVGAELQVGELESVILAIVSDPAGRTAAIRDPEVADPGDFLDPGETGRVAGADELARDRQGQRLGEGVGLRGRGRNRRSGQSQSDRTNHQPKTRPPRHRPLLEPLSAPDKRDGLGHARGLWRLEPSE